MKTSSIFFLCLSTAGVLATLQPTGLHAATGHWQITQLPIPNALHPTINNSGEIAWALNSGGGIYSSTRGRLAGAGVNPHLSNSGEVVYAGWFGGPAWDLASTTRGRLTQGGIIDVNTSDFDVNADGEVVYATKDELGFNQVFSTVRGQITFDAKHHRNPCINDKGEIAWNEHRDGVGAVIVSTTRGILTGFFPLLQDLNNSGDFCYSGNLEGPVGHYSWPHLFSSTHGVLIDDPTQFQWNGSLNDAGTIVWEAPVQPGSGSWSVYQAEWVTEEDDTTPPRILGIAATPRVLWPPNNRMMPVNLTVDVIDDSGLPITSRITKVQCNEPVNRRQPAWLITGALTLELRAERLGKGVGRIYTVFVECEDHAGNISSGSVQVLVPHSRTPERSPSRSVPHRVIDR